MHDHDDNDDDDDDDDDDGDDDDHDDDDDDDDHDDDSDSETPISVSVCWPELAAHSKLKSMKTNEVNQVTYQQNKIIHWQEHKLFSIVVLVQLN